MVCGFGPEQMLAPQPFNCYCPALGCSCSQLLPPLSLASKAAQRQASWRDRVTRASGAPLSQRHALSKACVRLNMSDMRMLTMRDLNRKTASVLDAVERGETFELRRNGRVVG